MEIPKYLADIESDKTKDFSFILTGRVVSAGLQGLFYFIFALLLNPELYGNLTYLYILKHQLS